ncbi:MAG TPA: hypothetical protein VFX22_02480, partial [Candidatus Kapabacteria bacterium]|nr:hypothetical protein [Candidatus Kapabacteria bacterium]
MTKRLLILGLIVAGCAAFTSRGIAQSAMPSEAPPRPSIIEIDLGRAIDSAEAFIANRDLHYTVVPIEGNRVLVSLNDTVAFDSFLSVRELFLFDSGRLTKEEIIPCGNVDYDSLFWICFERCGEPLKEVSTPDGGGAVFYLPMAGQQIMIIPQISSDGIYVSLVYPFDSTLLRNRDSRWLSF